VILLSSILTIHALISYDVTRAGSEGRSFESRNKKN